MEKEACRGILISSNSKPEANSGFNDPEPDPLLNIGQAVELLQTHHKAFTKVSAPQQFAGKHRSVIMLLGE